MAATKTRRRVPRHIAKLVAKFNRECRSKQRALDLANGMTAMKALVKGFDELEARPGGADRSDRTVLARNLWLMSTYSQRALANDAILSSVMLHMPFSGEYFPARGLVRDAVLASPAYGEWSVYQRYLRRLARALDPQVNKEKTESQANKETE